MTQFEELHQQHVDLMLSRRRGEIPSETLVQMAQAFLSLVREAGRDIADPTDRQRLEAYAAYWASIIFEHTKVYPEVELVPSLQPETNVESLDDSTAESRAKPTKPFIRATEEQNPDSDVQWFHPGEIVVVARVAPRAIASSREVIADVHNYLRSLLGSELTGDASNSRMFAFSAPGDGYALAFLFFELADQNSTRTVRDAVDTVHRNLDFPGSELELIGAMPHWHMRAEELSSGFSSGLKPQPVYPDMIPQGWSSYVYRPTNSAFGGREQRSEAIPVAVFDTPVNFSRSRGLGRRFLEEANNSQLLETIEWVGKQSSNSRYEEELLEVGHHHTESWTRTRIAIPDHGLFVAGLVHGVAPAAPVVLEPVLGDDGVGDFSLLLAAIQRVLNGKNDARPQIITLSLGMLPHPARLAAAWFGLRRPFDPDYVFANELLDSQRDERWVLANRAHVDRTLEMLEIGLRELARLLLRNNCLVVAAAGNDSMAQSLAHQPRLEPRLPARLETVLGVAATTNNPTEPAPYSNAGNERQLGGLIATLGGDAGSSFEPQDSVIGVYSGEFPDGQINETGWAFWSGTSMAAGIASGIAANFWASRRQEQPDLPAASILADLYVEASSSGPYVPELRAPAIEVRGRWRR